jgi:hypothetical protein
MFNRDVKYRTRLTKLEKWEIESFLAHNEQSSWHIELLLKDTLRAPHRSVRFCRSPFRGSRRFSCGTHGTKRDKGNLLYRATVHGRIPFWH